MWDRACIICWKFWEKKKCSRASIARWPCSNARQALRLPSSLRLFRRFCPGVPQRNRAVPGLFLARAVGIEREVAEALELIAFFGARAGKRRLAFRIHNFQRI